LSEEHTPRGQHLGQRFASRCHLGDPSAEPAGKSTATTSEILLPTSKSGKPLSCTPEAIRQSKMRREKKAALAKKGATTATAINVESDLSGVLQQLEIEPDLSEDPEEERGPATDGEKVTVPKTVVGRPPLHTRSKSGKFKFSDQQIARVQHEYREHRGNLPHKQRYSTHKPPPAVTVGIST